MIQFQCLYVISAIIALNNTEVFPFDFFVGGETVVAVEALPSSADHCTIFQRARINDFIFVFMASGAAHTRCCVELD